MELHAIGIDLGKTIFTWWVSSQATEWYARDVPAPSWAQREEPRKTSTHRRS
jgi:hypothetical protein